MKMFKLLMFIPLVLICSCEKEAVIPLEEDELSVLSNQHDGRRLPLHGFINAELTHFSEIPNEQCGFESTSNPAFKGIGRFLHFGPITVPEASHCNLPPISEDPFLVEQVNGQISFYTNRGDRFDATYTGLTEFQFEEEMQLGKLHFTITGGNGRFAGAQGRMQANAVGTLNTDPITFEVKFGGYIVLRKNHARWGQSLEPI